MGQIRRALTVMLSLIAPIACGGDGGTQPEEPSSEDATLNVRVMQEGTDLDLDGFIVEVRSGGLVRRSRLRTGGSLATDYPVGPGAHEVTLADASGNCGPLDGGLVRDVNVSAGQTVDVVYRLACDDIEPLVDRVVMAVAIWSLEQQDVGLFVVDPATGDRHALTTPTDARDITPHVSPDGKRVVFVRIEPTGEAIRIANADGTEEPGILAVGSNPRWSPDGSLIAFQMPASGGPDIHVIRPDSTGFRNVTASDGVVDTEPDWSPDGSRIAFRSDRRSPGNAPGDLFLIEPSGSGLTALTEPESGGDFGPRWSPDGTRIAFSSNRTGAYRIHLLDLDGAVVVPLGPEPVEHQDYVQAWSPDGTRLLFMRTYPNPEPRTAENDPELFILDLAGGEIVRLTDDGRWDSGADWAR